MCFPLAPEAFPASEINNSASALGTLLPENEVKPPRSFPYFINSRRFKKKKKKNIFFAANTLKYGIFITLYKENQ